MQPFEAVQYRNRRICIERARWLAAACACFALAICCTVFILRGGKGGPLAEELLARVRKQLLLEASPPSNAQLANWGYSGDTRPENWATLDSEYKLCAGGKEQSPIDINRTAVKGHVDLPPLRWTGLESRGTAMTIAAKEFWDMGQVVMGFVNGPIMQRPGFSRYMDLIPVSALNQIPYTLQELRFHVPSEHQIDGQGYDGELQLMHRCSKTTVPACNDDKIMVIAVLLRKARDALGEKSPKFVDNFLYDESFQEKRSKGWLNEPAFDLGNLNDALYSYMGLYFEFKGSLTMPPCTEDVSWFVLKEPVAIEERHLNKLMELQGQNNRPLQATRDRPIFSIPKY